MRRMRETVRAAVRQDRHARRVAKQSSFETPGHLKIWSTRPGLKVGDDIAGCWCFFFAQTAASGGCLARQQPRFDAFLDHFRGLSFKMLTSEDIGAIRQAYKTCKTHSGVARATGFNRRTVAAVVNRGFQRATYKRRPPPRIAARRRKLLALTKLTITRGHRKWPRFSSSKQLRAALATHTGEYLSDRQIRFDLSALGMKSYCRPLHPTRSKADLRSRREFAKKYKRADWKKVVFSDESWLCCNERTGRRQWCRRRCDALPMEQKARWNVASIMVWATVGYNWKGPLIIFPSKHSVDGELRQFRLDSKAYVKRCLSKVVQELKNEARIFQQDGARSHAAKHTMEYLAKKKVVAMTEWPAYSPDLNAIERLWKELNARVGARCPLTEQELVVAAQEEWLRMPQELINRHCRHFQRQLRAL